MRTWVSSAVLLAPVALWVGLAEWGAREIFGVGILRLFEALVARGDGDALVMLGVMGFMGLVAALGFGSVLLVWWGWMSLAGQGPVPHVYLGSHFDNRVRYQRADDPSEGFRTYRVFKDRHNAVCLGFASIYLRHLLLRETPARDAEGLENWAPLRVTGWPNALWPVVVLPVLLCFLVLLSWAPMGIARDEGLEVVPDYVTAVNLLNVHLVLLGELWPWLTGASAAMVLIMLPFAVRTARWSSRVAAEFRMAKPRLGVPADANPRLIPLPDEVGPGARLDGRIVETRLLRGPGAKGRNFWRHCLVEFAEPFDPPVLVGFRYRRTRRLTQFDEALLRRLEGNLPVRVQVQDDVDLSIRPLAFDGGPSPGGDDDAW